MNKPNTRILDYVTLVQDGVLTVDDAPQDIKAEVTKWVRYFAGIKDDSMVKDPESTTPAPQPEKKPDTTAFLAKKVTD
ncbi:hypothetical protein [Lactobacillus crispatus]|uniref:Uncharacterized protein n=1 Tax=Lactobacillus crispatus TaxID=47770 RepID=A0A6A1Z8V7_9LACO|nr:hypothetical protein [Lactobacillus crispatus]KAB1978250.1 hypothetical protein F8251_00685 [Lactobacillus crispatus]MCT3537781.1 hypothetical protein [Lactobacillus crispatus]MCT7688215.1 hypothetical protein [Lactobacillus crispatus]STX17726.1 Uncharacterised protein [Lactobacillus acidophilus]